MQLSSGSTGRMCDDMCQSDGIVRLKGQDLSCIRGERLIFSNVCFDIAAGEGLLLKGGNGAGKTSLLRALAGLVPFQTGGVLFQDGRTLFQDGRTLFRTGMSLCEQAHYVAHVDAVKPGLSVRNNLAFWADYLGGGDVDEALAVFHLSPVADLPVAYLSAGQKRKLSLSRLKLVARPVWLLDEPSVSLDHAACTLLAGLMDEHLNAGGILVAATHLDLGVSFTHVLTLGRVVA